MKGEEISLRNKKVSLNFVANYCFPCDVGSVIAVRLKPKTLKLSPQAKDKEAVLEGRVCLPVCSVGNCCLSLYRPQNTRETHQQRSDRRVERMDAG